MTKETGCSDQLINFLTLCWLVLLVLLGIAGIVKKRRNKVTYQTNRPLCAGIFSAFKCEGFFEPPPSP